MNLNDRPLEEDNKVMCLSEAVLNNVVVVWFHCVENETWVNIIYQCSTPGETHVVVKSIEKSSRLY